MWIFVANLSIEPILWSVKWVPSFDQDIDLIGVVTLVVCTVTRSAIFTPITVTHLFQKTVLLFNHTLLLFWWRILLFKVGTTTLLSVMALNKIKWATSSGAMCHDAKNGKNSCQVPSDGEIKILLRLMITFSCNLGPRKWARSSYCGRWMEVKLKFKECPEARSSGNTIFSILLLNCTCL